MSMETRSYRSSGGSGSSGALFFGLGILLGLGLTVAPWFFESEKLPGISKTLVTGFGVALILISGILLIITSLYVKTKPDEAILKTGLGGPRVVIDGGALIFPVVHETTRIPLHTMRIDVERMERDSLLTKDKLRADVKASFFLHVQKDPESIKAAAKSLGNWSGDEHRVKALVNDKIVAALRQVAATKTLTELNEDRKGLEHAVLEIMQHQLQPNGLNLESVNVSHLDQAPLAAMRDDSIFDAEGRLTIATQVSQKNVERNKIERDAEQRVKQQNVETARFIQGQDLEQAKIVAQTDADKAIAKAEAEARAKAAAAEKAREADVAKAKAEQAVQVAVVEQTKAVAVAEQQKQQAEATAEVERLKAIEIADREKQIAVADAEKRRAEAQAAQLAAEKQRQEAEQAVLTVTQVATAEREKQTTIIAQQAAAEKTRLEQNVTADVKAYTVKTEAKAAQEAAAAQAEAKIALADADKQAKVLAAEGEKEALIRKAEGDKAIAMVPVDVNREQVAVNGQQVEVDIKRLEGQNRFDKIARELQVELAKIAANRDAQIAAATAMGKAMEGADIKVFGDPTTMQRMLAQFYQGEATGNWLSGLNGSIPAEVKTLGGMTTAAMATLAEKLSEKFGIKIDPSQIASFFADAKASETAAKAGIVTA